MKTKSKRTRRASRWQLLQAGAEASASGSRGHGDYAFFLSHYRDEAGCHARLLQQKLIEAIGRPVYLDATDADDITRIVTEGVARCECLLLLQTKGILHRPFCLLEILEAVRLGIPIVPIAIEGCGYDFDEARDFCESSPTELAAKLEAANPGALAAVARGLTPQGAPQTARGGHASTERASRLLATAMATIPPIIAVSFDPAASDNHVVAVVKDVSEKKARAYTHMETSAGRQRGEQRKRLFLSAGRKSSIGMRPSSFFESSTRRARPSMSTTAPRATLTKLRSAASAEVPEGPASASRAKKVSLDRHVTINVV